MFIFLSRFGRLFIGVAFMVAVISLVGVNTLSSVPTASKHQAGTSSLNLVLLNSADGLPHYGQKVTFNPTTTVTARPYVKLDCYQNQVWVYDQWAGFYPDFSWPWLQTFPLSNSMWTSGAADCTATLYYNDGKGWKNIMSTPIHVYA